VNCNADERAIGGVDQAALFFRLENLRHVGVERRVNQPFRGIIRPESALAEIREKRFD